MQPIIEGVFLESKGCFWALGSGRAPWSACMTRAPCALCACVALQVRDALFRSAPFQRLLRCFTTLTMEGQKGEARRFRPGQCTTLAPSRTRTPSHPAQTLQTFTQLAALQLVRACRLPQVDLSVPLSMTAALHRRPQSPLPPQDLLLGKAGI